MDGGIKGKAPKAVVMIDAQKGLSGLVRAAPPSVRVWEVAIVLPCFISCVFISAGELLYPFLQPSEKIYITVCSGLPY